ncbi:hypothetical protein SUGI_0360070 [Cryptomeria japonica]|nr:hypothetical protein SUGI_0360070 [Cryptomeria japonica]
MTSYFTLVLCSRGWVDIGDHQYMEDNHICIDNFANKFECSSLGDGPWDLYGVFDGHGGKHGAQFVCDRLPNLIVQDIHFPSEVEKVVRRAFLHTNIASSVGELSNEASYVFCLINCEALPSLLQFNKFKERLLVDNLFLTKVVMECGILFQVEFMLGALPEEHLTLQQIEKDAKRGMVSRSLQKK